MLSVHETEVIPPDQFPRSRSRDFRDSSKYSHASYEWIVFTAVDNRIHLYGLALWDATLNGVHCLQGRGF